MLGRRERVFISYSTKNEDLVREDILPLLHRAKREYWYAPETIRGGENWRQRLLEGLDTCDRLLVLVSKDAIHNSDWVRNEVEHVTRPLLEKKVKLDARLVHRAILPVVIDERDEYGRSVDPEHQADPYLIHPYLTMVNYISLPFNAELDKQLDPHTSLPYKRRRRGKRLPRTDVDAKEAISESQLQRYAGDRIEALKNLETAIRNPESLRWGFGRLARLMALLFNATFQRFALAGALLVAVVLSSQFPDMLGDDRISSIDVLANGTRLNMLPSGNDQVVPVEVTDGLLMLRIDARTPQGVKTFARTLRPRLVTDEDAPPDITIEIEPVRTRDADDANVPGRVYFDPPQRDDANVSDETDRSSRQFTGHGERHGESDVREEGKRVQRVVVRIHESARLQIRKIPDSAAAERLALRVRAYADGEEVERIVELVPTASIPAEIEVAQISEEGVVVERYPSAEQISEMPKSEGATYLLIRAASKSGPDTKRYVMIAPKDDTPPADSEIEIRSVQRVAGRRVDSELMELRTDPRRAHEISVTSGPTFLLVRHKTEDTAGAWRYVRLEPPEYRVEGTQDNERWTTLRPDAYTVNGRSWSLRVVDDNSDALWEGRFDPPQYRVEGTRDGERWLPLRPAAYSVAGRPWRLRVVDDNSDALWEGRFDPPQYRVEGTRDGERWLPLRSAAYSVAGRPWRLRVVDDNSDALWEGRFDPPQYRVEGTRDGERWLPLRSAAYSVAGRPWRLRVVDNNSDTLWEGRFDPPQYRVEGTRDGERWLPLRPAAYSVAGQPWLLRVVDNNSATLWEGRFDPPQFSVVGTQDGERWLPLRQADYSVAVRPWLVRVIDNNSATLWEGRFHPPQFSVVGSQDGQRWLPLRQAVYSVDAAPWIVRVIANNTATLWEGRFDRRRRQGLETLDRLLIE